MIFGKEYEVTITRRHRTNFALSADEAKSIVLGLFLSEIENKYGFMKELGLLEIDAKLIRDDVEFKPMVASTPQTQ